MGFCRTSRMSRAAGGGGRDKEVKAPGAPAPDGAVYAGSPGYVLARISSRAPTKVPHYCGSDLQTGDGRGAAAQPHEPSGSGAPTRAGPTREPSPGTAARALVRRGPESSTSPLPQPVTHPPGALQPLKGGQEGPWLSQRGREPNTDTH